MREKKLIYSKDNMHGIYNILKSVNTELLWVFFADVYSTVEGGRYTRTGGDV